MSYLFWGVLYNNNFKFGQNRPYMEIRSIPVTKRNERMSDNNHLFKYFREELIDKASRSHIVLPISILDKEGGFAVFVTKLGPKHLIQLLSTLQFGDNNEILHFTRSCLSLLNITFTILHDISSRTENFDSITINWANESLNKCIDEFTVSVCIYLLVTFNDINDLILSLLLRFVKFSEKARVQMFKIPVGVTFNTSSSSALAKSNRAKSSKHSSIAKSLNLESAMKFSRDCSKEKEKNEICLSFLMNSVSINRNREIVSNLFIEILITLLFNHPENMNVTTVCGIIAAATVEYNSVTVEWMGLKLLTKLLAQAALVKNESKSTSQFYGALALVMAYIILNSEVVVSYLKTIPDIMDSIFNYLSPQMNIECSHAVGRFVFQEFYEKMNTYRNSNANIINQKNQSHRPHSSHIVDSLKTIEKTKARVRNDNNGVELRKMSSELSSSSLSALKTPLLPRRINAEDVLHNTVEYLPNIDHSIKYTEKKTTKVINKLSNVGEMRDGKNTVPIITRATRIYLPQGYPMYCAGGPMSLLALQIETRQLLKSRASNSRNNLVNDSDKKSLQVHQDQISTNIEGITNINSTKLESPKVSDYYNPTYDSPMGMDEIASVQRIRMKQDIEIGHTNDASPRLSKEIMIV